MSKHIAILTGPLGSGKTTACLQLAGLARQHKLDCAGIISPARFDGSAKVGIDMLDVRSGQRHPLAEINDSPAELRTTRYRFDTDAVAWGVDILNTACPCELFIVDEIGPLELERGQGWINALDILRDGRFDAAVVVVRPALIDTFCAKMKGITMSVFTLQSALLETATPA